MQIAVVIYDAFCMFELSAALENFAVQSISIKVFGEEKQLYRSEEGLLCQSEYTYEEMNVDDFDAILLTGVSSEEFPASDHPLLLERIREFHKQKKVIAAISAGPMLLMKAGILKGVPFMCGCPREGLLEEGFTLKDMELMKDGEECAKDESLICFREGNILTSVAWKYREWAMEIADMLGIIAYRGTFGLPRLKKVQ